MKQLYFHNTLSGKKELFIPIDSQNVRVYSCGPTVYGYAHIGNFRSFLFADLLVRTLRYTGYTVTKVQNITDVGHLTDDDIVDSEGEDKIQKKARAEKKDPYEIAHMYEEAFLEDEEKLRIIPPEHRPRATDFIPQQIALAKQLMSDGFAYRSNGSIYFETKKFKSYGKLSKNKLEDLQAGARVKIHSDKKDPLDFALWKKAETNHLMQWDSETGKKIPIDQIETFHKKHPERAGFPGWHIECSAMSRELLGDQFDIHTGGEDNIFPHHECEIAQNECSNGGKPSVNYWMHVKHLQLNGQKMSKSKGNFFTIRDLFEKGWQGEEIRYALLAGHYRTSLNFSEDLLQQARRSIARIREAYRVLKDFRKAPMDTDFIEPYQKRYQGALADDLNVSDSLAVVFEVIKGGMKRRDDDDLTPEQAQAIVHFLEYDFDTIFEVLQTEDVLSDDVSERVDALIVERAKARAEKNWAEADRIRDMAAEKYNVEFLDSNGQTTWKKRSP